MSISVVDWNKELESATFDSKVGLKITTLTEDDERGTYLTSLMPGKSVTAHYHAQGCEDYHILSGTGTIRLLPINSSQHTFELVCKHLNPRNSFKIPANVIHQLVNTGNEPLTFIFNCPLAHLREDRFIIEDVEGYLHGKATIG